MNLNSTSTNHKILHHVCPQLSHQIVPATTIKVYAIHPHIQGYNSNISAHKTLKKQIINETSIRWHPKQTFACNSYQLKWKFCHLLTCCANSCSTFMLSFCLLFNCLPSNFHWSALWHCGCKKCWKLLKSGLQGAVH